ncbi:hypothetical protein, partial [Burkholderia ambifaria]|uniref:hypothetical protein n=1 Tax=Burkholderia ambifaria TaxID=152480 RepID=UPI0012FD182E
GKRRNSNYGIGGDQEKFWERNGEYYFQRYISIPNGKIRDAEKISCSIRTEGSAVTTAASRDHSRSGQAWTEEKYITINVVDSIDYTLKKNIDVMSKKDVPYFREQYHDNLWAGIDDFYVVPHAARLFVKEWHVINKEDVAVWKYDTFNGTTEGVSSVASCYIVPRGYSSEKSAGNSPVHRFIEKTVHRDKATIKSADGEGLNIVEDSADMIWYNRSNCADTTLFFVDREHYGVWSGDIHVWYHDHHAILGDIKNFYKYGIPAGDTNHHHWDDTLIDDAIRISACNHRYPRKELDMYDEITTKNKISISVRDNYGNSGIVTVSTVTDAGDHHAWPQLSVNGATTL